MVGQSAVMPNAPSSEDKLSMKKLKYLKTARIPRLSTIFAALTARCSDLRPSNRSMNNPLAKLLNEVMMIKKRNLQSHQP